MLEEVKKIAINVLTALWTAAALLMLVSAYSGRLAPETFPWASTLGLIFPLTLLANLLFLFLFLTVAWKRAWLPVAAFLLAFPSISLYLPLHFGDQSAPADADTLTLMSYNVQAFQGPTTSKGTDMQYVDAIMAYIRHHRPDIVCLQECMSDTRHHIPRLDSLYAHRDTVFLIKTKKGTNCLGIFTRYPILHSERIKYNSAANGSMAWLLRRANDTLLVVSNHLETTHLGKDVRESYRNILHGNEPADTMRTQTKHIAGILGKQATKRAAQARAVAAYVDSLRQRHPQWAVIVCGDFNDSPVSYTYHTIAHSLNDCFQQAGCGPGWSMQARAFPVRIDHLLCDDHFTTLSCKVDRTLAASDHYPVCATLQVRKSHSTTSLQP